MNPACLFMCLFTFINGISILRITLEKGNPIIPTVGIFVCVFGATFLYKEKQ